MNEIISSLLKTVPASYVGYAAAFFGVAYTVSLTWLHFNLAKKYDLQKSATVPKTFFTTHIADNFRILGFLLFSPRSAVPSARAYGFVRLARFSLILSLALAVLTLWMWRDASAPLP